MGDSGPRIKHQTQAELFGAQMKTWTLCALTDVVKIAHKLVEAFCLHADRLKDCVIRDHFMNADCTMAFPFRELLAALGGSEHLLLTLDPVKQSKRSGLHTHNSRLRPKYIPKYKHAG